MGFTDSPGTRVGPAGEVAPPFEGEGGGTTGPSGAARTGVTAGVDAGAATAAMLGWLDDGFGAGLDVSARGTVPPQTAQKR